MLALIIATNKGEVAVPVVRDIKSVLKSASIYTGVKMEDITGISILINGEKEVYNYKNFNKIKKLFFQGSFKEKISWFPNILNSLGKLEMFHNDFFNTRFKAYKHFNGSELVFDTQKEEQSREFNFFRTISKIKKNGDVKVRYICAPSAKKSKNIYSDLKELLSNFSELEPEMLGCGLGVQDSVQYFNNFETLVKIDFKDFFNQITHHKLIKGLKAELPEGFSETAIKSIAYACCPYSQEKKKRATWQGLPTSTIAAYIAIKPLFKKIKEHLKQYGIVPTIYIDDLCFGVPGDFKMATKIKKEIIKIIISEKFVLNFEKCKVLYGNKTFFLGVNMQTKKLGTNSYVRNLKAGLNNFYHKAKPTKLDEQKLKGKLSYLKMINEDSYKDLVAHEKYGKFINKLNVV